jgi:hypothetical protein
MAVSIDGGRAIVEEVKGISIGVSLVVLVVGAILTFAVKVSASGFNINTVGIILMLAGALGLLLLLLFWSSFSPWSRRRTGRSVRIRSPYVLQALEASRRCSGDFLK